MDPKITRPNSRFLLWDKETNIIVGWFLTKAEAVQRRKIITSQFIVDKPKTSPRHFIDKIKYKGFGIDQETLKADMFRQYLTRRYKIYSCDKLREEE